jgi:hypothetical protein
MVTILDYPYLQTRKYEKKKKKRKKERKKVCPLLKKKKKKKKKKKERKSTPSIIHIVKNDFCISFYIIEN